MDGIGRQLDGLVPRHVCLPLRLKDGHGRQRTAAHGHVRKLVRTAVGMNGEEADACGVDTSDDEIGADVTLVSEKMLLEHRHTRHDSRFSAGGERVQLQLRGDQGRGELRIRCGASSRAPYLRRDVMKFLTVLGYVSASDDTTIPSSPEPTLSATMGPLVALVSAAIYHKSDDSWLVAVTSCPDARHLGTNSAAALRRREPRTTTPPSYMHPTIVVPVLVALGSGNPLA